MKNDLRSLISDHARTLMRCAHCSARLVDTSTGMTCSHCTTRYPRLSTAMDLRLTGRKTVDLRCAVGEEMDMSGVEFGPLEVKVNPATSGRAWHLSPELLSHLPSASSAGQLVLDLGCGKGMHRALLEDLGYDWVGMDYSEEGAPILADAHALPFADQSFDFVMSLAVLEHLRNPLVAMQECFRVMKPGAALIGTVAFMEPFHGNSYYHHSHLGTLSSLLSAGFRVTHVAPTLQWSVLQAQAEMAFFPRMPSALRRAAIMPLQLAQQAWWSLAALLGKVSDPSLQIRQSAGSFAFIAYR